jgi:hypothetical protein
MQMYVVRLIRVNIYDPKCSGTPPSQMVPRQRVFLERIAPTMSAYVG